MQKFNIFAAGFIGIVIGSISGYFYGKKKTYKEDLERFDEYYKTLDKYYNDRISAMEEEYKTEHELRLNEAKDKVSRLNDIKNNMNIVDYSRSLGYVVSESDDNSDYIPEQKNEENIKIIDADEFCDDVGYGVEYLTLYANKVLTDDYSEELVYPENSIGNDIIDNVFGHQNLGDVFYVKNDANKTYYEVTVSNNLFDVKNEEDI